MMKRPNGGKRTNIARTIYTFVVAVGLTIAVLAQIPVTVAALETVAESTVRCTAATSVSLTVAWDASTEPTDAYYVALSSGPERSPFALQVVQVDSTNGSSATTISTDTNKDTGTGSTSTIMHVIDDLLPNHTYYVSVRSHPSTNNIVWGWRASAGPPVRCVTDAVSPLAPGNLRRVGNVQPDAVGLTWDIPQALAAAETPGKFGSDASHAHHNNHSYEIVHWHAAAKGANDSTSSVGAAVTTVLVPAGSERSETGFELTGLPHRSELLIAVRSLVTGALSDAVIFRTSAPNTRFNTLYRLSEYTFDVDFLENHNSADRTSMGVYIYHGTPFSTQAVWPNSTAEDWYNCQDFLEEKCGQYRGTGLKCMACPEAHREEVVKHCGNFTGADDQHQGFSVHFFCGIGWPESIILNSSVAEYCVESAPPPPATGLEYAQYVSCNSDETDWFGNEPREPICQCWVYDDRMISQEPRSKMMQQCGDFTHKIPWVGSPQCNCTQNSPKVAPSDPSYAHMGRSPVWLPYEYYLHDAPRESYQYHQSAGFFYSTPRNGACPPGQAIGDNGCTWRRSDRVRVLWGPDLMAAGWDPVHVADTPQNVSPSRRAQKAFDRAVDGLAQHTRPRCCGC